jgi:hypothetical protein
MLRILSRSENAGDNIRILEGMAGDNASAKKAFNKAKALIAAQG